MAPARRCVLIGAIPLLAWLAPSIAAAQGAGRVMDIDPSPISRGMASASAAAFWTAEPNYWANPALLGYYRGARWQWGRMSLAPGLNPEILFTTNRYALGFYGIGLQTAGRPLGGMGRTYLDYGASGGTDPGGSPVSGFPSFEEVKSWSVGVSLARLVGSIAALGGHEAPAIFDHVDLAAGITGKRTEVVIAPGYRAGGAPTDHGVLLRCGIGSERADGSRRLPLRSDVALGASITNDNATDFRFDALFPPISPTRTRRLSAAIREALGQPRSLRDRAHSPLATLLLEGLEPMLSFGLVYENQHAEAGGGRALAFSANRVGVELTAMNALSLRAGYVSDPDEGVEDPSWGFGIALPIGDVAGARFDYAKYPQASYSGLEPLSPRSFSAFVDPLALARRLRGDAPRPD